MNLQQQKLADLFSDFIKKAEEIAGTEVLIRVTMHRMPLEFFTEAAEIYPSEDNKAIQYKMEDLKTHQWHDLNILSRDLPAGALL